MNQEQRERIIAESPVHGLALLAEMDALLKVAEAVTEMRDAWREDSSYIPPKTHTRDFGSYLIKLWNTISDYERLAAAGLL